MKNGNSIIRTQDTHESGFYQRSVLGLNIFASNGLVVPAREDPRIIFLRVLSEQIPCSAHVGSLALKDIVDAPEELFGPSTERLPYSRTKISFHDGFYDLNEYPCWDACFFPQVLPVFWEARLPDEENYEGIEYLLPAHGLALYVGAIPTALDLASALLKEPFPGADEWLHQITQLYPLVVTVGHDGDYFHAFTRDEAQFALLDSALAVATDAIKASLWFREHEPILEWEQDWRLCLIAKTGRESTKTASEMDKP